MVFPQNETCFEVNFEICIKVGAVNFPFFNYHLTCSLLVHSHCTLSTISDGELGSVSELVDFRVVAD